MILRKIGICLLSIWFFTHCEISYAQPKENALYSRFGLGDSYPQYSVAQDGMGGVAAFWNAHERINLTNPAALGFLNRMTLQLGVFGKSTKVSNATNSIRVTSGSMNQLAIAFPFRSIINEYLEKKRKTSNMAMALYLTPYHFSGYQNYEFHIIPGVDTTRNSYNGSGGTYRFGGAFSYEKNGLSGGVSLNYLFGQMSDYQGIALYSEPATYIDSFQQELHVKAFQWRIGVQKNLVLQPALLKSTKTISEESGANPIDDYSGLMLYTGAWYQGTTTLHLNQDRLVERRNGVYASGVYDGIDTIQILRDEKKEGSLPWQASVGLGIGQPNSWFTGMDFTFDGNQAFVLNERTNKLVSYANGYQIALGGEWIPDARAIKSYTQRIAYRLGLRYEKEGRIIDGKAITSFGIHGGFGFPLNLGRQETSFIDLSLEWGKRATDLAVKENYFRVGCAFSLNDRGWFFRRKYE